MDWLAELETGGVHALRNILSSVTATGEDEYLDVDDGSAAVAVPRSSLQPRGMGGRTSRNG